MDFVKVYHYDAFSNIPNKGNPAGVVLNGDKLSDAQMQEVARKVGFNETSFRVSSDKADLGIRYFTPNHEMNLCGHGTMATIYALKVNELLADKKELLIETKAGILPIEISESNGEIGITMKQAKPEFRDFCGSRDALAISLGLSEDDLEEKLPIVYGSTGIWTLLVPIKKLETFQRMLPQNSYFPDILQEIPRASVHPFCLEAYHKNAVMHARHFSSPFSGTVEDPVTGTASGVMGAYYATYVNKDFKEQLILNIEQGQEIGRDGEVQVMITRVEDSYDVRITGNAVFVKAFKVSI